jgi:hypothetical protein
MDTPTPETNRGPSDRTTMTDVIDGYREAGYVADFGAEPDARVSCGTTATSLAAESKDTRNMTSDPHTPPTKPLPDMPDEPSPMPMPTDPPLPMPGDPVGR